ncbi:COG4315 family predicted lipoprotein [Sinomonas mesophila]|uniref:COG4315 family predicted lipoprotein n=1 Tax=Sinomonas mesophila TaxID=1531955 RepID=UPI0009871478|nr:hypothetical protein [Sinomonas mesophila]
MAALTEAARRRVRLRLAALCAAAALGLAGCAGGPSTTTPPGTTGGETSPVAPVPDPYGGGPVPTPPAPAPASDVALKTATAGAHTIVVGGEGKTVYYYTKDEANSGKSACVGGCLTLWPPVTVDSEQPAVEGVTGTIGTIAAPDGKRWVTLNGLPLHYYANDTKAGDTTGQGVAGVWYVAAPDGKMITDPLE